MALELVKNQIIYAIHAIMTDYDVEDVDFLSSYDKPKFMLDGIQREIVIIHKPSLEDMSIDLEMIPRFNFSLEDRSFKAEDFKRLKTAENLFKIVYEKLRETFGNEDDSSYLRSWNDAIIYYTNQYKVS